MSDEPIRVMIADDHQEFRRGLEALLRTAEQSVRAAATLGEPNLNLHGTGLGPGGLPVRPVETVTAEMHERAVETLIGTIDGGGPRTELVATRLIVRASSVPPGRPWQF